MLKNIAIAVDGSTHSEAVLDRAAELASICDARCLIFLSVDPSYALPHSEGAPIPDADLGVDAAELEQRIADRILAKAKRKLTAFGIDAMSCELTGDPATAIVEAAHSRACDLIVMGHRHLNWLNRTLHPSVCAHVIERSHCPVMVVPANAVDAT